MCITKIAFWKRVELLEIALRLLSPVFVFRPENIRLIYEARRTFL